MANILRQVGRNVCREQLPSGTASGCLVVVKLPVQGMVRDHRIDFTPGVMPVARPCLARWLRDPLCPDGVEFDVAHADRQIRLHIDKSALVVTFPQGAGPAQVWLIVLA